MTKMTTKERIDKLQIALQAAKSINAFFVDMGNRAEARSKKAA